jgi:transcriptional regulator with GAF, ATPase, and Fis domain/pSer/pThr/pTyr-binding forkhead associated (FHA) protein
MPKLTIVRSEKEDQVFEFEGGVVTIGRAETNSIQLDDPAAEPVHCQIEATADGRFKLVDLETKVGTEVDGMKVNAHFLESGDRIYIGGTSIVFEEASTELGKSKTRRIPILKKPRLGRIPTRRSPGDGAAALRRLGALPPPGDEKLTLEDLRVVLSSLVAQHGPEVLHEARQALEQYYETHHGQPLYDALMHDLDNLYRMLDINKLINSEHNLKKLLELIMDSVIEMAGAERGFLILRERESLVIKVARNFDRESIKKPEFKVSHSVAEEVLKTAKPIISADALTDPNLPAAGSVADLKLRSLLCIPFRIREQVLGCVYIDNRFETGLFTEADLPLLQGFADQAATAIENARLFEENQRRQDELKRSHEEIERLNDQLKAKVEKQYAELAKVKQDLDSRRADVPLKHDFSSIIGSSRAMKEVFRLLDRVIDTDEPVFVHGESGTGKELAARAIHFNSSRAKNGKFVSENCSAIPDTLLESELFGHEKGAFTGATTSKPGLFELAHKGTLFLDEIGDMSLDMQKKLLRAIQEGEIRRVGGKDVVQVDVRMVSASNKDLAELIKTGQFREDLFYRLNVVKITLPPLRDRREDIPLLVEHFLEKLARDAGQPRRSVDEPAFWYLQNYSWPGNVRELDNEIRRAVAMSDGLIMVDNLKDEIKSQDLFKPAVRIRTGGQLKDIVREAIEDVERKVIAQTLEECGWKKTEASSRLGISRPTLDAKIEQYGLSRGKG